MSELQVKKINKKRGRKVKKIIKGTTKKGGEEILGLCCVHGCSNESYNDTFCKKHYEQLSSYGKILKKVNLGKDRVIVEDKTKNTSIVYKKIAQKQKPCSVYGCTKKCYGHYLCSKHLIQVRAHNKVFNRTRSDKNRIKVKGKTCFMELYNASNEIVGVTKFNTIHLEEVLKYKWHLSTNGYVVSNLLGNAVFLHRIILNPPKELLSDHINGDKMNNLDKNLRVVTPSENSMNRRKVKGYSIDKKSGKYFTYISHGGKLINLGFYLTKGEAKAVRKKAEIKYFKEYRYKK